MTDEVLEDQARFGQHQRLWNRLRLDGHDWELAKRMDLFELRWRQFIYSIICFDLIFDFEFFQEP